MIVYDAQVAFYQHKVWTDSYARLPRQVSINLGGEWDNNIVYCKVIGRGGLDRVDLEIEFDAKIELLIERLAERLNNDPSELSGSTYLLQYGSAVLGEARILHLAEEDS